MDITITEYISYLKDLYYCSREEGHTYQQIFSEKFIQRLDHINTVYGDKKTEETIQEIQLHREWKGCDYSFKILTGDAIVSEYWYELDYDSYATKEISPCFFIDASSVKAGQDNRDFIEKYLPGLAGEARAELLGGRIQECADKMEGLCEEFYQLGAMNGRGQDDRLRVFTSDMKKEQILEYLKRLCWKGDREELARWLSTWEDYAERKRFILDFDVMKDGISSKIGINFGIKNMREKTVRAFLDDLVSKGLCLMQKAEEVVRWTQEAPLGEPFLQNDISHFKFPFEGDQLLGAKAYLRQGSKRFGINYHSYYLPTLMNLELTTRCPLRCPQCYCDLTKGKDLDYEKALYWIEEAADSGIHSVNLSGGETNVYPHLTELIKACASYGLESNIALSGYGVTREKIQEWIDAGISEIFVSLNGSTEEINKKTRDGYSLAVHTLELLKEMDFDKVTINWVMHGCNADDFPQMIELAERYKVDGIAIMVFKPDSSHALPGLPTKEQMQTVAKQIKNYKGTLKLDVESCFSQMKALLGEKFFFNTNVGVEKGCGAGRDGISINVDGKITPCRHLEYAEETLSIRDYWRNSKILKQLRTVEDSPEEPCMSCRYLRNCIPCMAVNVKLRDRIYQGSKECILAGDA